MQRERVLSSGAAFRFVALLTVAVVVVGGSVEALVDTRDFSSTWDGIWWAVVTVTTVGYGDLYPRSVDGRIIGMMGMVVGVGFLSVLTAAIASVFVIDSLAVFGTMQAGVQSGNGSVVISKG